MDGARWVKWATPRRWELRSDEDYAVLAIVAPTRSGVKGVVYAPGECELTTSGATFDLVAARVELLVQSIARSRDRSSGQEVVS